MLSAVTRVGLPAESFREGDPIAELMQGNWCELNSTFGYTCRWNLVGVFCVMLFNSAYVAAQEVPPDDLDKPLMRVRGIVVDEAGNPVVGAVLETISQGERIPQVSTESVAAGAFLLSFTNEGYYGASIIARDPSKQLAAYISGYRYTSDGRNIVRLTLKPLRHTEVTVVDKAGQPLADATVQVIIDYAAFHTEKTDSQGKIRVTFPADASVMWIVAYKDDCGFDYYENSTSLLTHTELPHEVRLTLNGAKTYRVKVVDTADQPLAGIDVIPWLFQKIGKREHVNLSGWVLGKSDANGIAEFRFIPEDVMSAVTFDVRSDDFYCRTLPRIESVGLLKEATAKVYQLVTLRGKLTHEDGSPAAGIRLQGEGRDAANKYFRGYTSTKTDGTYELKIYPNQPTLIAVTDEHVAAQSIETLPMAEGKLLENVDLKVGRGVLISGTFTVGDDNRPAIDQTATLIQQGSNGSQLVRWCQTDKSGRYVFRVGPGDYSLRLMDDKELNVAVKDENLEFDCHLKRLPRGPLSGKVTDGDGNPVSSLLIIKSISTATHGSFKVQSKSDGTFATEKYNDPIRVIAICAEQRLFGMREIEADAETVDIVVAPAASLNCVVLDAQDKPLEGCRVIANQGLGGLQNDIETQTDANGKCTFPAVGTGFTWTISANSDGERKSIRFKVEEAKSYDVPALKMSNVNAKQE